MKVLCRANTGDALSPKTLSIQYNVRTQFSIDVGRVCTVYGMLVWRGILQYLLIGFEGGNPSWYPAELFSVVDNTLSIGWHFSYPGNADGIMALWGYNELVTSNKHYEGLIDLEPHAIDTFVKRMPIAEQTPQE